MEGVHAEGGTVWIRQWLQTTVLILERCAREYTSSRQVPCIARSRQGRHSRVCYCGRR